MYKLLSIDLDGTLLNDKNAISKQNKEAIKYAQERGLKICINTGRNFPSCIDFCRSINADYVIFLNGCFIMDLNKNTFIRNRVFSFIWMLFYSLFPYDWAANKSYGLKKLCKYLSINLKETVSIGDSVSDLSMIKKSGLGICVLNSGWTLKFAADYVTKSDNNSSAVAEAIYYIFDY